MALATAGEFPHLLTQQSRQGDASGGAESMLRGLETDINRRVSCDKLNRTCSNLMIALRRVKTKNPKSNVSSHWKI